MTITPEEQRKKLPAGSLKTMLKFERSGETGAYIGFVSKNPRTGRVSGVRQDSPYPKKVCVVDARVSATIIPNVLYDVVCVPMRDKKKGYVVISAEPHQFQAVLEVIYTPKVLYQINVKFGNKTVKLDLLDGNGVKERTVAGVRSVLERRFDIKDITQVVEDFNVAASELVRNFRRDGFYAKA